ncbi:MAG: hypothetical protein ACRD26_08615 [Vicinamibacterales bacterium]
MKAFVALTLAAAAVAAAAQEREVPKDSVRLSIPGCVEGRRFIVMRRDRPEPVDAQVQPGRRFRLNGQKKILQEMQAQKATMVEVTGLIRKSQVTEPGIGMAGGRVRIRGGPPQAPLGGGAGRDSMYNEAVLDVESWRSLPDPCPAR